MGEGMQNDAAIMPYISSANIACGYHAGDEKTIWETLELAAKHKVNVGAHISFLDRENFGRKEMDWNEKELYDLLTQQLLLLDDMTQSFDLSLHHVKPHGALYNMSAKNTSLAMLIAKTVHDFNENLILYGLSGSYSILAAQKTGLKTASEVFADRTYQDDGSLTTRSEPGALIEDGSQMIKQVSDMIENEMVNSVSGKKIPILAETICIHGDGKHAVEFAKMIYEFMHG